jgi:hypothetical protein
VLALYHSVRHPSQRQYPAWSADHRPRNPLERVLEFVYDGSTRYILPSALLAVSSFLVVVKTGALRSTYICPVANSTAATIPTLQFIGFLVDCVVVQLLYRLVDDAISPADNWTIHLKDGSSNQLLVGLTFIVRTSDPPPNNANNPRHHRWFLLWPAWLYIPPCPSTASGCSLFLLNIFLVFCVYR